MTKERGDHLVVGRVDEEKLRRFARDDRIAIGERDREEIRPLFQREPHEQRDDRTSDLAARRTERVLEERPCLRLGEQTARFVEEISEVTTLERSRTCFERKRFDPRARVREIQPIFQRRTRSRGDLEHPVVRAEKKEREIARVRRRSERRDRGLAHAPVAVEREEPPNRQREPVDEHELEAIPTAAGRRRVTEEARAIRFDRDQAARRGSGEELVHPRDDARVPFARIAFVHDESDQITNDAREVQSDQPSAFSIAATISGSSGAVSGAKRATTLP